MAQAEPQRVPEQAWGPAHLVAIDADIKFNGPALIAALFKEHGGMPEGCIVITKLASAV